MDPYREPAGCPASPRVPSRSPWRRVRRAVLKLQVMVRGRWRERWRRCPACGVPMLAEPGVMGFHLRYGGCADPALPSWQSRATGGRIR